jgi:hypothetical protein
MLFMKLYAVLDDGILVSQLFRTYDAAVDFIISDYKNYKQVSDDLLTEIREELECEGRTGDWEIVDTWLDD